ncbi:MAG: SCO family protein [Ignavibacteria bacterium]|nr:SCO family protein [Ignavibacteria bacterium]
MNRNIKQILRLLLIQILIISINLLASPEPQKKAALEEQLGNFIPLDAKFTNENGQEVTLREVIKKPTILTLVFYECKGICTPLLTELAEELNKVDLELGRDFQIVTISFDPEESAALAKSKKANYIKLLKNKPPDEAWTFLVGDSSNIYSVTNSVGFYFFKEEDQFVHPGALIFISPEGKITRYLLGIDYLPFNIKMAILEAGEGKVGPTIAKLIKFCYAYDAEGRTYALNITRIIGIITLLAVGIFVIFLISKSKKRTGENKL